MLCCAWLCWVWCCSIKLTPFFYYNWDLPANAPANEDQFYRHIVTRWKVMDANYTIVDPTSDAVSLYTDGFAVCISKAINLGFEHIYINPMVSHREGQ